MKPTSWDSAHRIICIRLDSLGDVLMTTPAIRAFKESLPGREISLLTSPSGAQVANLIPEVDETIVYEAPWMKATPNRHDPAPDFAMIERLRQGKFDAAVIFTVFSQNPLPAALMVYLAGIPLRLAYCRENPYQLLTEWIPDPPPQDLAAIPHEVQRHLDLAASVGCLITNQRLSLSVPQADRKRVEQRLNTLKLRRGDPWVVIHPGATAPSRRYPPELFAQVAECLVQEYGWQVVFTGVGSEKEMVAGIRQSMQAPSLALTGELSLGEMAALLSLAPLLIANNTGPVHMAAALGTPVVDLYALTNPQHTPWQVPHRVLNYDVPCKFCFKSICPEIHHNCLRKVSPDEVVEAAVELAHAQEQER